MATRLLRNELLEHPVRTQIFELIRDEPGIAFLAMFDRLRAREETRDGLGFGSLQYHLDKLERFGFITNRKSGRHRRYYENGGPFGGATTALSVLQVPTVSALARHLLEIPGGSQRELWNRVRLARPCTRQAIGYHLVRLAALDLVVIARNGRAKAYYPTERLQRLMAWVSAAPDQSQGPPMGELSMQTVAPIAVA